MMTHEIGSRHTVVFIQQGMDGIGTPRSVPRNGRVPGIQIPGAPRPAPPHARMGPPLPLPAAASAGGRSSAVAGASCVLVWGSDSSWRRAGAETRAIPSSHAQMQLALGAQLPLFCRKTRV